MGMSSAEISIRYRERHPQRWKYNNKRYLEDGGITFPDGEFWPANESEVDYEWD